MTTPRAGLTLLAAATLFAASLWLFWPGIATYDTVAQYRQVLAGVYDDWHPPAMARLWSLLAPLAPGVVPMLAVQLGLFWLGLGLLAGALARSGAWGRAAAVLLIGAWPVFLGWQGVVLKDGQLVGALVAATGIVGWWRLGGRTLPAPVLAALAVLLAYALLVRANGVFAVMPFLAMLVPAKVRGRAALLIGGTLAVLAATGPINHGLLHAEPSEVEKTQALYDLAGIAVRTGPGGTPLDDRAVATLQTRHCVKPFFWDPLGDAAYCNAVIDPLRARSAGTLYTALAGAALAHPLAYAKQRLAHLNSTERWLVADRWPSAMPPDHGDSALLAATAPREATVRWQALAGDLARTPAGWPIAWIVLALALIPMLDARPAARLAAALIMSALMLEASFTAISIASDLRYHLWPMIATALAVALVWRRPLPRGTWVGLAVLAIVIAAGCVARVALPAPPQTYAGMLGWRATVIGAPR